MSTCQIDYKLKGNRTTSARYYRPYSNVCISFCLRVKYVEPIDVGRFALSDKNTSKWQSMSTANNCAKEIYEFKGTRIFCKYVAYCRCS